MTGGWGPALKPNVCWLCDVPLTDHNAAIAADARWLTILDAVGSNLNGDAQDAVRDAAEVVKASLPACRGFRS